MEWRGAAKTVALILSGLVLGLALVCSVTSSRWVNTTFPGFFVMANRVIASVSLPSWPVARLSRIYQHAVVAVNEQPVSSSEELHAIVRQLPVGSPITYTTEQLGQRTQVVIPSLVFTLRDYGLLFGAYLVSGLTLAFVGLGVWALKPAMPASQALLITGLAGGVFALTGLDLYGPHWFFRLHVMAEAFFPAGLIHLACVFPVERTGRRRRFFLSLPYLVAGGLSAAYELYLYQPDAYSRIHNLSTLYGGLGGIALLGSTVWAYATTDSQLIRQKIRVVLVGFLGGFFLPALLMLFSGMTGGNVAVNYAGFTVAVFPLSLGYAIAKHDLFEIDAMLRRGVYYLALTVTLTIAYAALLTLLNFVLQTAEFSRSPLFPLLFALSAVLLLNPLKDYLQRGVDRLFFRLRYNPRKVLEATSAALASTLRLDDILALIWRTLRETMNPRHVGILLLAPDKERYVQVYPPTSTAPTLARGHVLLRLLQNRQGRVLSRYDCTYGAVPPGVQTESLAALEQLHGQVLAPLTLNGGLIGFVVLGVKESGAFFSADDIEFLSTLANQSTLSIANALAYQEIQTFNVALEHKVEERTQALADTNAELHASLGQLEQAYRDLQRSQEQLVRAEKMADLGRLTAGIAHEMNTPLGASLTSLQLLKNLVHEYRASIGDRVVTEHDHHDIATEMEKLTDSTQQWMEKAAAHIRSLKLHTRDLQRGEERLFSVLQTIEDTRLLLTHRLRLSQCQLTVSCTVEEPMLHGDPGKFGQVLTNLIGNAMDAYKDAEKERGAIVVAVQEAQETLEIRVHDQGCGIPPDNLEKIFDELFSTKPLGEGTGLGLTISRNIMTNFFGGAIRVESTLGQGSTFILSFPRSGKPQARAPLQDWQGHEQQNDGEDSLVLLL